MKSALSPEALPLIREFCAGRPLLAFDFDGTLAPIVQDPDRARISGPVMKALKQMCGQGAVAVISGRALQDLRARIPENVAYAIGNHGLEGLPRGDNTLDLAVGACEAWRQAVLPHLAGMEGVTWEDKSLTAAVHYRQARPKSQVRGQLLQIVSGLVPTPRLIMGKDVINLVPTGPANKGAALLELMMHLHRERAIYVGDDDTDEDVFSIADQRILGIRVGRKIKSAANYFIPKQSDIGKLIALLSGPFTD